MTKEDLKERRQKLEYTQEVMAEAVGVSIRQYKRYEKGEAVISKAVEQSIRFVCGETIL